MARVVALVIGYWVSAVPIGQADSVAQVEALRRRLTHYGHGNAAAGLEALAELQAIVTLQAKQGEPARVHEARFVRAAIATDLYFLATYTDNPVLEAQVAQSLGVAPARLPGFLDRELASLADGAFAAPATRARKRLAQALDAPGAAPPTGRESGASAPEQDSAGAALLVKWAADATVAGEDLATVASRLAEPANAHAARPIGDAVTPPPDGKPTGSPLPDRVGEKSPGRATAAKSASQAPQRPRRAVAKSHATPTEGSGRSPASERAVGLDRSRLTPASARVAAGLQRLAAAHREVSRAASEGGRLAQALLSEVEAQLASLAAHPVAVAERLPDGFAPQADDTSASDTSASAVTPHLYLQVGKRGVRYGRAPRLRPGKTSPVAWVRGHDTFPNLQPIDLPHGRWGPRGAYGSVGKTLAALCEADAGTASQAADTVVAITAAPGANTAVFTALLQGLSRADCGPVVLLAQDAAGIPLGLPLSIHPRDEQQTKRDEQQTERDVGQTLTVRVDPQGFAIITSKDHIDCPRARTPGGAPHLQYERLAQVIDKHPNTRATLSYVGWARLDDILALTRYLGRSKSPVDIVLP